jgi:Tfp pilus assembly protein PilO
MSQLIQHKRKQLVLVCLGTLLVLAAAYYYMIRSQQQSLASISSSKQKAQERLDMIKREIAAAERFEKQLEQGQDQLKKLENGMASGDLYSWSINMIRDFKLSYRIDIPQFSQIDGPRDMNLIPRFPYKQASLSVAGTGHFHDLGRFVADFENRFPYMRILNVVLEPETANNSETSEKLSFKMDVVMLVKPGV